MVRTEILARFRGRWLAGALPMVVEHRSDDVESLCAAPSLWMGGRELAEALERADLGPGARVAFDLPLGIRFVQGLVACLRRGAAVDLRSTAREGAAAVLSADALAPAADFERHDPDLAWIGPDGDGLRRERLDRLTPRLAELHALDEGLRVLAAIDGVDAETSVAATLAGLWAGCELHVLMDAGARRSPVLLDAPPERGIGLPA